MPERAYVVPVPPFDGSTCDEGHRDCPVACTGCGRCDPCGIHFEDCPFLEPGGWVVTRTEPGEDMARLLPE
jgi:hypothetical protein